MYQIKEMDLQQVIEIYKKQMPKHFPADEIKPLKSIERMWDMGAYRGLGMYEIKRQPKELQGKSFGNLVGYAFFSQEPGRDMLLMDYLAVLEAYRSRGIGGKFLGEMRGLLKDYKGVLIETEDMEFAQNQKELAVRQKRDAFYERNGVIKTSVKGRIYNVDYAVWIYPLHGEIDDSQCRESIQNIYKIMIPGEKYEKNVWIR